MSITITNLNGDNVQVLEANRAYHIDFGLDVRVGASEALDDIQVFMPLGDETLDRLGIDPTSGFALSNGFIPGSVLTYNGARLGEVGDGGSGTYNFHILFDEYKDDDTKGTTYAGTAQKLIQALTYTYIGGDTIPAEFSRTIGVILAGGKWDSGPHFMTVSRNPGGAGGSGNTPPQIGGELGPKTVPDAAMELLSGVTIKDAEGDFLYVVVTIDQKDRGSFVASSLGGGTYDPATGQYMISGTPAKVQAAVQKLVFAPVAKSDTAPSSETLTFTIEASDGKSSTIKSVSREMWFNRDDVVTGGSGHDKLYGGGGKDKLNGGLGNDKLYGGLGNDILTGGKGKDAFVFDTQPNKTTNKDKIVDFSVKDDSIWLDNAVFTKLGKAGSPDKPVQIKKDYFKIGSKAKDKNDYLVYDDKKGVLYYDADGSGKGKAVEIATLSKNLALTYKDFFVI